MQTPFTVARQTLTLWYCLILFSILLLFSVFLYKAQSQNFTRVVLQRDFGSKTPRALTRIEKIEILAQIQELRRTTLISLLSTDVVVMLLGAGLSYFLAGVTLQPIESMIERQKEFLANASHELRTPLAALQTSSEVALRVDRSKDEYKTVLSQTQVEAQRLGKIVNDLLLLSRADSAALTYQLQVIDVLPVVKDVLSEISPLVSQKELHLEHTQLHSVFIKGDADKLKQLFLILLDNAIKYTPKGGKISVVLTDTPKPIFRVLDTGIGMRPNEVKKIFNRFYRADSSRSSPGSGLGLSIAKWILTIHNAHITVKSTIDNGSIFTVTFPKHA